MDVLTPFGHPLNVDIFNQISKLSKKGVKQAPKLKALFDEQNGNISAAMLEEFFRHALQHEMMMEVIGHLSPTLLTLCDNPAWMQGVIDSQIDKTLIEVCTNVDLARKLVPQLVWNDRERLGVIKMMLIVEDDAQVEVLDYLLDHVGFAKALRDPALMSQVVPFLGNTEVLEVVLRHGGELPWNLLVTQGVKSEDVTLLKWCVRHCGDDFNVTDFVRRGLFVPMGHGASAINGLSWMKMLDALAPGMNEMAPNTAAIEKGLQRWMDVLAEDDHNVCGPVVERYLTVAKVDLRQAIELCRQQLDEGGLKLGTLVVAAAQPDQIAQWLDAGLMEPWLSVPCVNQVYLQHAIDAPHPKTAPRKM